MIRVPGCPSPARTCRRPRTRRVVLAQPRSCFSTHPELAIWAGGQTKPSRWPSSFLPVPWASPRCARRGHRAAATASDRVRGQPPSPSPTPPSRNAEPTPPSLAPRHLSLPGLRHRGRATRRTTKEAPLPPRRRLARRPTPPEAAPTTPPPQPHPATARTCSSLPPPPRHRRCLPRCQSSRRAARDARQGAGVVGAFGPSPPPAPRPPAARPVPLPPLTRSPPHAAPLRPPRHHRAAAGPPPAVPHGADGARVAERRNGPGKAEPRHLRRPPRPPALRHVERSTMLASAVVHRLATTAAHCRPPPPAGPHGVGHAAAQSDAEPDAEPPPQRRPPDGASATCSRPPKRVPHLTPRGPLSGHSPSCCRQLHGMQRPDPASQSRGAAKPSLRRRRLPA